MTINHVIDEIYQPLCVLKQDKDRTVYLALSLTDFEVVDLHLFKSADKHWYSPWQMLENLEHTGLVRVMKKGETDGFSYIALEHLAGLSLDQIVRALADQSSGNGALSEEETLHVGIQLTQAIGYLHSVKVIARTLAPETIFVGNDGRVVITALPFAIGKDESGIALPSQERIIPGPFTAPEHIAGSGYESADIFSICALLYFMLSGNPITNLNALELQILGGRISIPLLSRYVPGITAEIEKLVMQCLAYEPEKRVATCEDLRQELLNLLKKIGSHYEEPSKGSPILANLVTRVRKLNPPSPKVLFANESPTSEFFPSPQIAPSSPQSTKDIEPTELHISPSSWIETEDGRHIPLDQNKLRVGRPDSQKGIQPEIAFPYPWVHRRYLLIERIGELWYVTLEPNATNGARVNQRWLEPEIRVPLKDGDIITLGKENHCVYMTFHNK